MNTTEFVTEILNITYFKFSTFQQCYLLLENSLLICLFSEDTVYVVIFKRDLGA